MLFRAYSSRGPDLGERFTAPSLEFFGLSFLSSTTSTELPLPSSDMANDSSLCVLKLQLTPRPAWSTGELSRTCRHVVGVHMFYVSAATRCLFSCEVEQVP